MIKYFCDHCGDEITNKNTCGGRLKTTINGPVKGKPSNVRTGLNVEVMTSKDSTKNDGLFCKYCVLKAVQKLDDRPIVRRSIECPNCGEQIN